MHFKLPDNTDLKKINNETRYGDELSNPSTWEVEVRESGIHS